MAQVWLVTGSSRGLGRAIVEAGLAAGNKVLATARGVESLAELPKRYGDQVKLFALDVTDEAAAANAVKTAINIWLAGCGHQQCGIRQYFLRRRHASIGIPRTNRNESLRNDYCDQGGSYVFSRKENRPLHSVFIGRRKDRPSGTWALLGGEMGCRRLL